MAEDTTPVLVQSDGYAQGNDLLLEVDGKCIGHCTGHTINYNTETKDHAVKAPAADTAKGTNLFKQSTVTGLSISISFKGLHNYGETEEGLPNLEAVWRAAKPVTVKSFWRGKDSAPNIVGNFILSKLTTTADANDDIAYDGELQNTGAPETWDPKAQ